MKKLILFIFVIFLFQNIDVNSFTCSVKDNCASEENLIFYMYSSTDTHISTITTSWPKKLCCTSEISNSCSADVKSQLFKLYSNAEGHISTSSSTTYPTPICISLANDAPGYIECNLKPTCDAGEQCIITLSSTDDAHVSDCSANGYSNKVCCKATVCPVGFTWDFSTGTCKPAFAICYTGNVGSSTADPGSLCGNKWRNPISQNDPYWIDAIDADEPDCFRFSNAQACCYVSTYNNKEYGAYQDINLKTCTVDEIINGQC